MEINKNEKQNIITKENEKQNRKKIAQNLK